MEVVEMTIIKVETLSGKIKQFDVKDRLSNPLLIEEERKAKFDKYIEIPLDKKYDLGMIARLKEKQNV